MSMSWPGARSQGISGNMIVCAIFVLVLTDSKFASKPVNAARLSHTTVADVTGKLKRSGEGKGCQLPSPLRNGLFTPSIRRCRPQDTSPSCRMVPGTRVPEDWPIYYHCNPGYILHTNEEETAQRRVSVCSNGQWIPTFPACLESHYNSQNLPQFLSSSSYCGKSANNLRTKRKVSMKGAWPWMAIFGMRKNNSQNGSIHWFCAGTLVTTRHILTAAHCVADQQRRNKNFFARFNDIDLDAASDNKGSIEIEIQVKNNIVIHPGFKTEKVFSHNLAIVKLNEDLPITDFVRPICLPTPDFSGKSFNDETVYFTSWGQTENDGWTKKRHYRPILQERRATVVKHADCNDNYRKYQSDDFIIIGWDLICASVPTNKSCQGDAGSPLMLKIKNSYVLIGVVATPFRCYDELYPRLFTRLSVYMDWIIANLKL